jgi:hypothetical protein
VFTAFNEDHMEECTRNCNMMRRVASALNITSPNLKSFIYPGGSRVRI